MRHGRGQLISNNSTLTLESGDVIPFPYEFDGEWVNDQKHGRGTILINVKNPQTGT